MRIRELISCSVLALSLAACAQDSAAPETNTTIVTETMTAFEASASEILAAAYPETGPGVAAIITKDNETVFIGGRGLANIKDKTPITGDTVFRLASITKQLSAATLLLLAEDGLVDLDAPLSTYLPEYPEPGASITVRRLLNHTSGIPSYTGLDGAMRQSKTSLEHSTEEMVAMFADLPLEFEPGERFSYNNSGYILVGAVIEAASGQDWAVAVKSRIGAPLGLETLDSGIHESDVPLMATGYSKSIITRLAQDIHMSYPGAAGALISDVQDLADWANALHDGEVLSESSYLQMIAPTVLNNSTEVSYGYGIGPGELLGTPTIGHNGGIFGFSTDSMYLPEHDVFVAVLANSDSPEIGPNITMRKLAALAIDAPFPTLVRQDADLGNLEPLFGTYRSETVTRSFFVRDGKLFTSRENGLEAEVFAAGENRFFYGPNGLEWFEIETDAEATKMKFYTGASPIPDVLIWSEPM